MAQTYDNPNRPPAHSSLDIPNLWKHAILVHTALPDWPEDTTGVQLRARAFHDIAELYGGNLSHVQLSWLWRMPRDSTYAQSNSVLQYIDRYVWFKLVVGDFFSHFTGFYSQLNTNDGKIHAPLLEELCLICYKATIEQEVVEFEAPMLKRLALYDHPMDSTRQFILPWHQLTQLSVGEPRFLNRSASLSSRWRDLTRLLHSLSSLEYLHLLNINIHRPGDRHLAVPVTMARLRVLEIHDRDLRLLSLSGGTIFSLISTPALENLDLVLAFPQTVSEPHIPRSTLEHNVREYLRQLPKLLRIRVAVYFDEPFLHSAREYSNLIVRMSGDAQFFKNYEGKPKDRALGDSFCCYGDTMENTQGHNTLHDVTATLDHFIDCYLEGTHEKPGVDLNGAGSVLGIGYQAYENQTHVKTIKAVMRGVLGLGDEDGVNDGVRVLYTYKY